MNHLTSAPALALCLAIAATCPAIVYAQSAPNRHKVEFVRTYATDFETGANPINILTPGVTLTTAASEVVSGLRSLKLDGGAVYAELPAAAALQPGRFYMLSLRYRMLRPGRVGLTLRSPGAAAEFTMLGELPVSPVEGAISWSVWVPGVTAATILFYALDATITFDDIYLEAQTPKAWRASLPMITSGFPRLGDYMLLSPAAIADMHGDSPDDAERTAARFDLLVGSGSDHTQGAALWTRRVRALNPSLLVLPYRQAYMAQFDGSVLQDEFNTGLAEEWFMRSTISNRLAEPMFPMNVQLNHTLLAPAVDGQTLADYSTSFLKRRVLGSGLWDGIQFDQPEWYINPLLGEPLPPIDLDRNGAAEPLSEVYRQWASGFANYFRAVNRQFGYTYLSVGNAGYLSSNPSALSALNGWIAERVEPYPTDAAGNWKTSFASGWYGLLNNYLLAGRIARAPQLPLLEFTGAGLGTLTGGSTPNGVPMRSRGMTVADYRRMRLGLTTALLGNGYFEYDLVDNTTPALWFDEYAVNASGIASTLASAKGYLGQPLSDAEELPYPSGVILNLDFETPSLPASTYVNGRVTTVPSEVIAGSSSLVVTKATVTDFAWFIWSAGQLLPGRTYQLSADYRVLSVEQATHVGLVSLGFTDESGQASAQTIGSVSMPDVDGPGQQGTLRASLKTTTPGQVFGLLHDVGTVAIDNVRLVEGTGGVWRRDFEKGIVLVNPTPEPLTVSLAQIAGPRQRTAIKRILGTQQPAWNSGQPVTSAGIVIPSGDGIILLANSIGAATIGAPGAPVLAAATDAITAQWSPASGYPAGYQVLYGEDPAHLTRIAASGRDARVTLENVLPGARYYVRVAAYDFKGNLGPASAVRSVVAAGVEPLSRPAFSLYSTALVPGAVAIISGTALADLTVAPSAPYPTRAAGTRIEVNGIEAPLYWVSPTAIAFVTPWDVAGPDAVINVIRGSAVGRERLVPMRAALPQLLASGAGGNVIAFHQDGTPVTATTPARRGEVIDVLALGLGAVTMAPDNGVPPPSSWIAATVNDPIVTVGGIAATSAGARLEPNMVGVYRVTITIPAAAPSGPQPMRLGIAGEDSNILAVVIQ